MLDATVATICAGLQLTTEASVPSSQAFPVSWDEPKLAPKIVTCAFGAAELAESGVTTGYTVKGTALLARFVTAPPRCRWSRRWARSR
jgi:hypothetical protein